MAGIGDSKCGGSGARTIRVLHVSHGALLGREVAAWVVNPNAGNPNTLCISERLKEGVGGRQWLRKSLGIGRLAECADADPGEDRRFGIRAMTHMHLHHGSEWQSAAMLDDSRHMRSPCPLASSKRPEQGRLIRSAASCSKGLPRVNHAPAALGNCRPAVVAGRRQATNRPRIVAGRFREFSISAYRTLTGTAYLSVRRTNLCRNRLF